MNGRAARERRQAAALGRRAAGPAGIRFALAGLAATVAALVLLATGARTSTIPPQTRTLGSLAGIVRGADGPSGLAGVTVTLRNVDDGAIKQAVTGPDGTFGFGDLAPGRFALHAAKPGYVATNYGADPRGLAPGLVLALDAGETLNGLDIPLARGAAIAGRLTDETGAPVAAAEISALIKRASDLGTRWTRAAVAVSDDRGAYRLFGLADGAYAIAVVRQDLGASPGPPRPPSMSGRPTAALPQGVATARNLPPFVPVFYPGTPDLEAATFVKVQAGADQSGIDLRVGAEPAAEIQGVLTATSRLTLRQVHVTLTAALDSPLAALGYPRTRPAVVAPTGHFTFERVPQGTYGVFATTAPPPSRPAEGTPAAGAADGPWYAAAVAVVGDVGFVGLDPLPLRTGVRVAGRVTMAGDTPAPGPDRVVVRLTRIADGQPVFDLPPARVRPDGSFELAGVPPGRYTLAASISRRTPDDRWWHVDRAAAAGHGLLDAPLEVQAGEDIDDVGIHLTNRITELIGTVFDPSGRPSYAYYLVAIPIDPVHRTPGSRWLRGPTRPDSKGVYQIVGLPPGEYYLAVVTDYDPEGWWAPSFLQQMSGAALRVTLTEGQRTTQSVRAR